MTKLNSTLIALILITLCLIDFYTIANYKIVDVLLELAVPFDAVMLLSGVAFCVGILGLILLLSGDKK